MWESFLSVMSEQERDAYVSALLIGEKPPFNESDKLRFEQLLLLKNIEIENRFADAQKKSKPKK